MYIPKKDYYHETETKSLNRDGFIKKQLNPLEFYRLNRNKKNKEILQKRKVGRKRHYEKLAAKQSN